MHTHHDPPARIARARLTLPPATSARFTHTVGTYPSMRMPGNIGAIHLDTAEFDPGGSITTLAGTWYPRLRPIDTAEGDLVLQLLPPVHDPTLLDRADLHLWLARARLWRRLRAWNNIGPGWPHDIAPFVQAALPLAPPRHGTTAPDSHDAHRASRTGEGKSHI